MPVLSIRIVLDCFYLLIFYSEKFSTHVCRLPYATNVNLNLSSDFNCTTRKSTLSHTTVFLLQVMRFAKLNKPPLSFKSPPSKVLEKNKPPGGLNRGFTVFHAAEKVRFRKITALILDAYAACPEPDTSSYFRFSKEYGFVSTNIRTMTRLISVTFSLQLPSSVLKLPIHSYSTTTLQQRPLMHVRKCQNNLATTASFFSD